MLRLVDDQWVVYCRHLLAQVLFDPAKLRQTSEMERQVTKLWLFPINENEEDTSETGFCTEDYLVSPIF